MLRRVGGIPTIDFLPSFIAAWALWQIDRYFDYHSTLALYPLTKVFKQHYLISTMVLFLPLLDTGVNSWLHLGMISSLRGIKELVDQVPVFDFAC